MNTKIKNIVVCVSMAVVLFSLSLLCFFGPKKDFLLSERRSPEKFPELTVESLMKDGTEYDESFMSKFEKYALDAFPLRDTFRTIKAICSNYIFRHLDNNDIYIHEGYAAKKQAEADHASIDHAVSRFQFIYDRYLKDKGISPYVSVIPDKAYFFAEENGYLSMSYEEFISEFTEKMSFAEYIDITGALELEDYYKTDSHWRQEKLTDVAEILVNSMGGSYSSRFDTNTLDNPFYGVYYGQAALPMPAETIYYLTSPALQNVKVFDHQNNKEITLYDMEKAFGNDPYDMFLSGELSYVTIENPDAKTDKELVVFRDSFGRSIIPLLAEDYAKITVIDIRYLPSTMLGFSVKFEDQDVLFLYSTLVLNASSEIK